MGDLPHLPLLLFFTCSCTHGTHQDEPRPGRSTKALPGGGAAEAARRGSDDATTTHQQRQSSSGGGGGFSLGSGATAQRRTGGDWAAVRDSGVPGGKGLDMLAELGAAQDYNINVDHGAFRKAGSTP
jgi:hypothetical protein